MKSLNLIRVARYKNSVFGVLIDNDNIPFAVSVENATYLFPDGIYSCIKSFYNKGGYDTFEILVPQRSRILFHKGNFDVDSTGCVIIGDMFGVLDRKPAILYSASAFSKFISKYYNEDKFLLYVSETKSRGNMKNDKSYNNTFTDSD